jgi:hypothetical protein
MNRITAALHRVLDFLRQCHGWVAVILAPALAVHAGLAEPDVIVWGTVSIQGTPVTARRTDVVLEARDTASGAILASYRMGTLPAAADHFVLRIPVQATVPLPADPLAASLGSTTVRIQVATALQLLGQQPVAVPARGQFQRLDIALSQGADANDLPDEWENAYFGSTGQNPDADPDVDGLTTREEFEAGTDPVRPDEPPNLGISRIEGRSAITFEARAASGPGYAGLQRRYTLESAAEVPGPSSNWTPEPAVNDLPGTGQQVQVTPIVTDHSRFFRLRLRLARIE